MMTKRRTPSGLTASSLAGLTIAWLGLCNCGGDSATVQGEGEGEGQEGEGEGEGKEGEGEGEGEGTEGEGDPACTPDGSWAERWSGSSAVDGSRFNGDSVIRVVRTGAGWRADCVDRWDAQSTWGGTLELRDGQLLFEFSGADYRGSYTCTFSADCDRLDCQFTTELEDGTPNMTGTATWTRQN